MQFSLGESCREPQPQVFYSFGTFSVISPCFRGWGKGGKFCNIRNFSGFSLSGELPGPVKGRWGPNTSFCVSLACGATLLNLNSEDFSLLSNL